MKIKNVVSEREGFSTKVASYFSSLSSAVGLGNIWMFPVLTGLFGGASFIFCYIFFALLTGIPVMVSEYVIGRRTRTNAIDAFGVLGKPYMKITGVLGLMGCLFILFFYSSVAGWVYSYIGKAITGEFKGISNMPLDQANTVSQEIFNNVINGLMGPFLLQLLVITVVAIVLILGVKRGIERLSKTLMPVLFLLLLICAIKGLTQPGAAEALKFLFVPDISKLNSTTILTAMGLAFFKLSAGSGTQTTYGSYFTGSTNLVSNAIQVCISDIVVSILAGIAIFPVVFTFHLNPESGPGLLFNTIPLLFSKIPMGGLFMTLFFVLTGIAATMAMLSLVEPVVAFLSSKKLLSRNTAILITSSLIAVVGFLTMHQGSYVNTIQLFGLNMSFFDFFNNGSSNYLLPIAGILFSVTTGWMMDSTIFHDEITNNGTTNKKVYPILRIVIRYLTPILILVVFLNAIGILK
ncbi:MAG: sodium-dependent transporter [Bacillales bacterium]|jgi:NSS family neurotransmitter:Na+ symporter|nr:sodium-dependent transporter [Bacillales bacterium]